MAKVCAEPGCPELTHERYSYCESHERERKREQWKAIDRERPSASKRGYDSRWRKARKAFLAAHRWCVYCEAEGKQIEATEVDHVIPHKGDRRLFWKRDNWQGLCHSHHSAKTMHELRGSTYTPKGCDARGRPTARQHTDWFQKWGQQ